MIFSALLSGRMRFADDDDDDEEDQRQWKRGERIIDSIHDHPFPDSSHSHSIPYHQTNHAPFTPSSIHPSKHSTIVRLLDFVVFDPPHSFHTHQKDPTEDEKAR